MWLTEENIFAKSVQAAIEQHWWTQFIEQR